jgi:excisionase family DNA binding protein
MCLLLFSTRNHKVTFMILIASGCDGSRFIVLLAVSGTQASGSAWDRWSYYNITALFNAKNRNESELMAQLLNGNEVITPSEADSALAKESGQRLAAHLGHADGLRLELKTASTSEELILPPSALRLLQSILNELGQGNAVTLTPIRAELTTQQAADLLNVSRPHLVKLLDEGVIASHKVGTHRRVQLEDLLAYKRDFHARRQASLEELAALSQDLDMGY